MYRRRYSPYSQIAEIRRSRSEIIGIVLVTVALGVLVGFGVNAVFDLLTFWLPEPVWAKMLWLVFLIVWTSLFSILVLGLVIWQLYMLAESEIVHLDIAVPYHLAGGNSVAVPLQHRFRPEYKVVALARLLCNRGFSPKTPANRELASAWKDRVAEGKPFQSLMYDLHEELVDALILFALHRYAENSLGPEAKYDWLQVDIPTKQWNLVDLPEVLQSNRFVDAILDDRPDWKLILPAGVQMTVRDVKKNDRTQRTFGLNYRGRGQVLITRLAPIWVADARSLPGKVISDGVKTSIGKDFYVMGTRATASATYTRILSSKTDAFHDWSAGLLAQLEEMLDWRYFLASRGERIMADLPWKIGELPEGESLWDKLATIDTRLAALESELLGQGKSS